MKKLNIYILCMLVGVGMAASSCSDQLDQTNPNAQTEATFWKTQNDFNQALVACYSPLKEGINGGYYGTRGVMLRIARADEVEFRNDISDVFQACYFTNSNGNSEVRKMFYQFYSGIFRCNSVLQHIDEAADGTLTSDFVKEARGEASFLRALYYFNLAKEFKNVPLRLKASESSADFPLASSSQKDVWDQAIKDCATAAENLPVEAVAKGKPTRGAAYALMGKIYLYEKDYDNVIKVLEPLTKSPYQYSLCKDFRWNIDEDHEFNSESIFEAPMEDVGGTNVWSNGETNNTSQTTSRAMEYASSVVGGWFEAQPTKQIMDIMTQEKDKDGNYDYRARVQVAWNYPGCMYYKKPFQERFANNLNSYWILSHENWDKDENEDASCKSCINERVLRYDAVILNLAEAYLFKGDLQNAVKYINMIRNRANLADYSGSMTKEGIFADLEHQRAIEFFVEGERFYDLVRWGLLDDRIKTCNSVRYKQLETGKVDNTNKYYYYPIPSAELETNPLCEKSEGW
jgi:hypothetical protein